MSIDDVVHQIQNVEFEPHRLLFYADSARKSVLDGRSDYAIASAALSRWFGADNLTEIGEALRQILDEGEAQP